MSRSSPSHEQLEHLDAALGRLRRLWERPEVRQWFQERLDVSEADATVYRTLRAVRLMQDTDPSVGGVAELLRVDASTASRFVERAVAAGFVGRSPAPDDRRRSELVLTESGRRRLLELRDLRVQFLAVLTEGWSSDEIASFVTTLDEFDAAVTVTIKPGLDAGDDR